MWKNKALLSFIHQYLGEPLGPAGWLRMMNGWEHFLLEFFEGRERGCEVRFFKSFSFGR